MRTVAETKVFSRYAAEVWTDAELSEFISWIAKNPTAGDVIRAAAVVAKYGGRQKAKASAVARALSTFVLITMSFGC